MAKQLKISITYDDSPSCPIGESGDPKEKIVTFRRGSTLYEHPRSYFQPDGQPSIGLRRQLECKTAFILSCYSHGAEHWGLEGEVSSCPWDTVRVAGIYWVPSDVPRERREEYARGAMAEFTQWVNGWVYSYCIEEIEFVTGHSHYVDSCSGFFDEQYMLESYIVPAIASHFDRNPDVEIEIRLAGEALPSWSEAEILKMVEACRAEVT